MLNLCFLATVIKLFLYSQLLWVSPTALLGNDTQLCCSSCGIFRDSLSFVSLLISSSSPAEPEMDSDEQEVVVAELPALKKLQLVRLNILT